MDRLSISRTANTPEVLFDPSNSKFEISGHSFPENAVEVYKPVFDWIDNNVEIIDGKMVFDFKLDYFNTASAKLILDLFMKLEKCYNSGKDICINWYFDEEDIDMQTAGEDYSEITEIPFEIIPVEDED